MLYLIKYYKGVIEMKSKSGVHLNLERRLATLGYDKALKALDLVVDEMSVEKGFARHDGSDYYEHLIAVTQFLINCGYQKDEDLIVASLLHDIVEDVEGYTVKLIEKEFNGEVAEIVKLVTKEKGVNYKNNSDKMEEYLNNILKNRKACLVKVADRIHNFSTLTNSSLEHRKNQVNNTLDYMIPFFKQCRKRYVRDEYVYYHAKMFIEPLAYEIRRYLEDIDNCNKNK